MLKIGCHLSSSGGYLNMINTALSIKANTFQFFTRNPRGGQAKGIEQKDIDNFYQIYNESKFTTILAHAPYTMNLCSDKENIRRFAINVFKDDLNRLESTPHQYYNFHPGSDVGQGVEVGINHIVYALNECLSQNQTTTVLLETMTGKGSEIGRSFEELKEILDRVNLKDKMGVCLDTCHIFDAGYDIVNNLDAVIEEFDRVIGLNYLKAIHLNDSMNECGSKKDRHAKIGEGKIGLEAITRIINHPRLKHLPFFLETPNELDGYQKEIELLRSLYKE